MNADNLDKPSRPTIWVTALIVVGVIGNLVVPDLLVRFRNEDVALMLGGALLSQPALLAIWLILGIEPAVRRAGRVFSALIVLWFAWIAGLRASENNSLPLDVGIILGVVTLSSFAFCTATVGIYRWISGRALRLVGQAPPRRYRFQVSIKQLLIVMTVIGVSLVLARVLISIDDKVEVTARTIGEVLFACLMLGLGVSLLIASSVEFSLGTGRKLLWLFSLVLGPLLFSLAVTFVLPLIVCPVANRGTLFQVFCELFMGGAVTMTAALYLVRYAGFRLGRVSELVDPTIAGTSLPAT